MSIILTTEEGWIISHLDYLYNIYKHVQYEQQYSSLQFKDNLFKVTSPYLRQSQIESLNRQKNNEYLARKGKRKATCKLPTDILEQNDFVNTTSMKILEKAQTYKLFRNVADDNNAESREESKKFYTTLPSSNNEFYGVNSKETPIIANYQQEKYVFPEYSKFYCYDIRKMRQVFSFSKKFDLVLLDPPWWNKSIKRKKKTLHESSYNMMYNEELTKIPIAELLNEKGIVAIWCTNSATHLNSILHEMFPTWGITFIAKWYWLKITQNGQTICKFNDVHGKQPYEQLIIGTVKKNLNFKIPNQKIIISIPSAVHSHKPPLTEILKPYLPNDPNCMEIFARYLLPKWTSWGLEVLKFQYLSLYNIIKKEKKSEDTS